MTWTPGASDGEPPFGRADQERGIRQPFEAACEQVSLLFIFDLFNMDPRRFVNATSPWFPALLGCAAGDPDLRIGMRN